MGAKAIITYSLKIYLKI